MWFKEKVYDQVWLWQMECCQPCDCIWNAWNELYDKWIDYFTNMFQKWSVVEYVKKLSWTININILERWTMYIVKQNDFELGCIAYGTTNCLLSSHTANTRNVFLFAMLC